jgi:DNA repair exonuclease SbcCD nuclease subunit
MRVAFLTDLHVREERLAPPSDQAKLIERTIASVLAHAPNLVLLGGDLTGFRVPHRATPKERNVLLDLVVRLGEVAPVVAVRGNHDYPGDFDFFNHLRAAHEIAWIDEPIAIEFAEQKAIVYCLPWLEATYFDDGEWATNLYREYLEVVDEAADDRAAHPDWSLFILGHGALNGAIVRPGQPSVPTKDPLLPPRQLCKQLFDACFWGHYHERQEVLSDPPTWYGGSLFANEYGEAGVKGWLLYDSELGIHPVEIHQPQRVVAEVWPGERRTTVTSPSGGEDELGSLADIDAYDWSSKMVKLRIHVPAKGLGVDAEYVGRIRAAARMSALSVIQKYITKQAIRAREGAEKVAKAASILAKLEAYWDHLDPAPHPQTRKAAYKMLERMIARIGIEQ